MIAPPRSASWPCCASFSTGLALIAAALSARAAEAVDLLLVLAADVSRSVDQPKFQLQRDGYAAAINDPRVIECDHVRREPADRALLRRMVGRRRAESW